MHATFTSGAARRAAVAAARTRTPMQWSEDGTHLESGIIDQLNTLRSEIVNRRDDERGLTNPILDAFRDDATSGDMYFYVSEWLFQLARHWSEWQSPRSGTFPLEYRDPAGPVTRQEADDSGEDLAYWDIEAALDDVDPGNERHGDLQQDLIVHATAVLTRLSYFHPVP
jgi:hypothetical protein